MFNITEIFSQEMNRVQQYNSYRQIYNNIPQMAQALNTYVDNILSPDDFTKDIFNIYIKDVNIKSDNIGVNNKEIIDNCDKLIETYKLENQSKKILEEALMIGDCFVSVLNVKDEIEKTMLSEDGTIVFNDTIFKGTINEADVSLSQDEVIQLNAILNDSYINKPQAPDKETFFKGAKPSELKKLTEDYNALVDVYNEESKIFNEASDKLKHDLAELVNNVEYTEDYTYLFEDNIQANKEYETREDKKKKLFNNFHSSKDEVNLNFDGKPRRTSKGDDKSLEIHGSIIKILKPDRIVKLSLDEVEYGYYYVENLENEPDYLTTGSYSMSSNVFSNFRSEQTDKPDLMNAKYRLITDVFVRNLAKRINKKFINKNPEFKDTIYNLLKQNYILNKQVRIVYLSPNQVIHFGMGNDEYKDSIFKPIHFSAKLYLAVLTSQVMLRLVRSPEKRKKYAI
jgi:hypothetical protein